MLNVKIPGRTPFVSACMILLATTLAAAAEAPVPAEQNPPGDIPDNQVFITYKAPAGFSMQVPEGWSRTATRVNSG